MLRSSGADTRARQSQLILQHKTGGPGSVQCRCAVQVRRATMRCDATNMQTGYGIRDTTYLALALALACALAGSESDSSVSRLLATLLCRPSESSL